jgi:hypothetical protein
MREDKLHVAIVTVNDWEKKEYSILTDIIQPPDEDMSKKGRKRQ